MIAWEGIAKASFSSPAFSLTRANCPGNKFPFSLGICALTRTAAITGSTWLSITKTLPS